VKGKRIKGALRNGAKLRSEKLDGNIFRIL
jgi:hypothetical protein